MEYVQHSILKVAKHPDQESSTLASSLGSFDNLLVEGSLHLVD